MSMIMWVVLVAKTEIAPLTPAGTIAAFAVMAPVRAFSVETNGFGDPAGHVVRKAKGPDGTTVMFKAYAWAVAGIPQRLARISKLRLALPASAGAPKRPAARRVSATRQGVTG